MASSLPHGRSDSVNPHTHDWEEGSFKSIKMAHKPDVLSGDSVQLTLARTKLASKLAKVAKRRNLGGKLTATHTPLPRPISLNTTAVALVSTPPYVGTNAHHDKSRVRPFPVT